YDWVNDIAVDPAGNIYAVGTTSSLDFPLKNPSPPATYSSAFLVKLNPKLSGASALLNSTFLGGTDYDEVLSIALDPAGNVYLTGVTTSYDFPMKNAFDPDYKYYDAFVMKLNPNLTGEASLLYSTYLGGTSYDTGFSIAVDPAGLVYVAGSTVSEDFPKKNHFRTKQGGDDLNSNDVFVTKLDTNRPGWGGLLYSTYISGSGNDKAYGVAVDSAGNIYVAGSTDSPNFPVKNQYLSFHQCAYDIFGCGDGFVTKLNPNLPGAAALLYSSYIGSGYLDYCTNIGLDAAGHVYVAGVTTSLAFPWLNGYLEKLDTSYDAFVMKFDLNIPGAAGLLYSTALGGPDLDYLYDMAVDPTGIVYLTGESFSLFPLRDEYQGKQGGDLFMDAFVAKLDTNIPGDGGLIFSTYLGGGEFDSGRAVAFDGAGNVYVAGVTDSLDFPKKNHFRARQDSEAGVLDAFITVLTETLALSGRVTSDGTTGVGGVTVTLSGSQSKTALTDSTGSYSFGSILPGGNYAITPSKGGLVFIPSRRSFIGLRDDQTGVNFTTRRAAISGRVTIGTAAGAPLSGVTMKLTGGAGFTPRTVNTSSTGAYSFGNVPTPGNYRVTPSKVNYNFNPTQLALLNLTANQTATNFVATLKSYTVSGVVKLGDAGLGGVKVTLASPTPAGFATRTATTDSAGAYSFANVPPARSYTVTAAKTGYQLIPASRSLPNLSANQPAANFSVKVYSIRGRITEAGTLSGVFAATVTLTSPVPAGFSARIVHTDFEGYYTFLNLPAGRNYTLKPSRSNFTFSPASRSFANLSGNIPAGASTSFIGTGP
ncbi:MAG TPA: SBBP repeat-containing protein, partial [Pyrinomonadaceae bacterium]|nr:SBBP repeat-containing protein [Pyrinomonadaceae bacterium]